MYGNELLIRNLSGQSVEVKIRKRVGQGGPISEVLCDETPITWAAGNGHVFFGARLASSGERRFRVVYADVPPAREVRRSLRFELGVAIRRILSEFRDDYVSRSRLLSVPAATLRNALRKRN